MNYEICSLRTSFQNSTYEAPSICSAYERPDKSSLGYGLGVMLHKIIGLFSSTTHERTDSTPQSFELNTSNLGKFEEFKRLFASQGIVLKSTHFDLREIDADPLSVVTHKASQLEDNVLVEDTSLEIENASVGVNVRWMVNHLHEYTGHKADWTVLLAYRLGNPVFIYKGSVSGKIVKPTVSNGFGFDPVFLPDGARETLAESKPNQFNARAKAVEALLQKTVWAQRSVIEKWHGPWQKDDHIEPVNMKN